MKKQEMKDSHCPLWIIGAIGLHVGMWFLTMAIFPNLATAIGHSLEASTEVGEGFLACLGLGPTGVIVVAAMWAVYTNFGKEDVDRK